jgi:hypothetical protein
VEQHDVERITRAALKELGMPNADITVTADAGRPGQWCVKLRGGNGEGPSQLKIRCGEGTSPQFVREQVFQQFAS